MPGCVVGKIRSRLARCIVHQAAEIAAQRIEVVLLALQATVQVPGLQESGQELQKEHQTRFALKPRSCSETALKLQPRETVRRS